MKDYDYTASGAYFITVCTKNREQLLGKICFVGADAHIGPFMQLSPFGKVLEEYIRSAVGVEKYVIMPNHVHLLLRIGGPMWASAPTRSVSDIIRSLKTLTTKACGRALFQRSFYDHIIRSETELLEVWKYIDENPLRWESDRFYPGK